MKVGFAVQFDEGLDSIVYDHFGSAPFFIVIDVEEADVATIDNKNLHHAHGACNPIMALDGRHLDAVVVGGIGGGALGKLNALGIRVFGAEKRSVKRESRLTEGKQTKGIIDGELLSRTSGRVRPMRKKVVSLSGISFADIITR